MVDEYYQNMTFVDISALAYHGERVLYFPEVVMPYNNQKLGTNWMTPSWSKDWDLWSIGIITLEIIIGSEMVLPLKDYQSVQDVVFDIMPFISRPLHQLLDEMLFKVRD